MGRTILFAWRPERQALQGLHQKTMQLVHRHAVTGIEISLRLLQSGPRKTQTGPGQRQQMVNGMVRAQSGQKGSDLVHSLGGDTLPVVDWCAAEEAQLYG